MAQTATASAAMTATTGAESFNAVASNYAALVDTSYANTVAAAHKAWPMDESYVDGT